MELEDTVPVSTDDYVLLGKLFVMLTARNGMPFPAEILTKKKKEIARKLSIDDGKVVALYQLLFTLSVQLPLTAEIQNPIGFDQHKKRET